MSTIINSRSPYYFKVSDSSLNSATVQIYIWTGQYSDRVVGDLKYTLSKQEVGDTNYVVFEVSELVRDFLETEYGNYSTDSSSRWGRHSNKCVFSFRWLWIF